MIESILPHPIANLFLISVVGTAIGIIKVANIPLEASAFRFKTNLDRGGTAEHIRPQL